MGNGRYPVALVCWQVGALHPTAMSSEILCAGSPPSFFPVNLRLLSPPVFGSFLSLAYLPAACGVPPFSRLRVPRCCSTSCRRCAQLLPRPCLGLRCLRHPPPRVGDGDGEYAVSSRGSPTLPRPASLQSLGDIIMVAPQVTWCLRMAVRTIRQGGGFTTAPSVPVFA